MSVRIVHRHRESDREQWRAAVAGVLAKSGRKDPADLRREPEQLLDSPTYEGFPIRPLYTILDSQPEPPLPGRWPFVRGGDALRDVKSGWKVAEAFPAPGQEAVADGNGAVLVGAHRGRQRAGAAGRAPDGVAADDLDRLLEGVFLELVPVVLDAGADFAAAADAVLALVTDMDDEQRARLSIDLGADPLTAALSRRRRADRSTMSSPPPRRRSSTPAACGRSRSTGPRSTISAPTRRGSWPAPSPRCQLSATARRRRVSACGCVAADQLPARRRRRPVHDDRQAARAAPTVGPGRRGGGRAGRRRGTRPCGDVDADDGAA